MDHSLLLHAVAHDQIEQFIAHPGHAALLVAPNGAGKGTIGHMLAARLLGVEPDRLAGSAHFKLLAADKGKSISVEEVRAVAHFLMLRSTHANSVARVVLVEHAGDMTAQAQNALLKTIEEPPPGTVLILTVASELDVLPTIRSRVQLLNVTLPTPTDATAYFGEQGHSEAAIAKAVLMSGALPGLTHALLTDDTEHPLVAAAGRARELLQRPLFERLLMIDDLTKQKQEWLDTLFIAGRMAEINLQKPDATAAHVKRWHGVLSAAHEAYAQTLGSAQIKLVGLHFMLSI